MAQDVTGLLQIVFNSNINRFENDDFGKGELNTHWSTAVKIE